MPMPDDKTLLKQARQGSREAMQCLYEQYKAPLLTLANVVNGIVVPNRPVNRE